MRLKNTRFGVRAPSSRTWLDIQSRRVIRGGQAINHKNTNCRGRGKPDSEFRAPSLRTWLEIQSGIIRNPMVINHKKTNFRNCFRRKREGVCQCGSCHRKRLYGKPSWPRQFQLKHWNTWSGQDMHQRQDRRTPGTLMASSVSTLPE